MTSTDEDLLSLDHYVRKTFHKTASLMANSCKAIAILGGQDREVAQLAWEYGRHVGLAFQVSHRATGRSSGFLSLAPRLIGFTPELPWLPRADYCAFYFWGY